VLMLTMLDKEFSFDIEAWWIELSWTEGWARFRGDFVPFLRLSCSMAACR
jgi:hypothetical protein